MRFFRPSLSTLIPPLLLVLLAFAPSEAIRQLFFGLLATPLQPAITHLGLRYRDVGFLGPAGAVFTALIWAVLVYVILCAFDLYVHAKCDCHAYSSNQSLERTADRREDLLSMTSTLKLEARFALVSGRSALSR
jgi:hypothetical protein